MHTITVGPHDGELTLHTGRAGVGSKVGHDLTLRVGQWSATADLDDNALLTSLRLVAALGSLEVLRGDGGIKPLTDKDKETILGHAKDTLRTKAHPEVIFEATGLRLSTGTSQVAGQLSLAGAVKPQTVDLDVTRDTSRVTVQVRGTLLQTDFGIKPYSGLLGALRVRDLVEVRTELTVSM